MLQITKKTVLNIIEYLKKTQDLVLNQAKYQEDISPEENLKNILKDLGVLTLNDEFFEILKRNLNVCTDLSSLYFENCSNLTSNDINEIKNCCNIDTELGIKNIKNLETLDLKFGNKKSLKKILIKECDGLKNLSLKDINPSKKFKQQVRTIEIKNCKNLEKLTISKYINTNTSISEVIIFNCGNIKEITLNQKVMALNLYLSTFDHKKLQEDLKNVQKECQCQSDRDIEKRREQIIRSYVEGCFLKRVKISGIKQFTCFVCFNKQQYTPIITLPNIESLEKSSTKDSGIYYF